MRRWQAQLDSLRGAYSENTIRAYGKDFAAFEAWCQEQGSSALPASADTVADYVAELAITHAPATIRRRVAGILRIHRMLEEADPGNTEVVRMAIRTNPVRH